MRTINKNKEDTDKTLSQAFTDSEALMKKAKELVCLLLWFLRRGREGG
jgi:hypothetical protein